MYDGQVLRKGKEDMAGAGGKAPAAPDLKKIGPRNTITFFPRASHESFDLLGADYKDAEQSRQV